MNEIIMQSLADLEAVLQARKTADPESSYVAKLHEKGLNKILEKVGEECTETILAAKDLQIGDDSSKEAFIGEMADLWFHTLVLLSHVDCSERDIIKELARRFGTSGIDEKASRPS